MGSRGCRGWRWSGTAARFRRSGIASPRAQGCQVDCFLAPAERTKYGWKDGFKSRSGVAGAVGKAVAGPLVSGRILPPRGRVAAGVLSLAETAAGGVAEGRRGDGCGVRLAAVRAGGVADVTVGDGCAHRVAGLRRRASAAGSLCGAAGGGGSRVVSQRRAGGPSIMLSVPRIVSVNVLRGAAQRVLLPLLLLPLQHNSLSCLLLPLTVLCWTELGLMVPVRIAAVVLFSRGPAIVELRTELNVSANVRLDQAGGRNGEGAADGTAACRVLRLE